MPLVLALALSIDLAEQSKTVATHVGDAIRRAAEA